MKFTDFLKEGQVRRANPDIALIKSLYKNTINDLKYLESQKISIISARKLVVNYYDCLRAVLEAIASIDGFKIYQHEAFSYFLKEKGEEVYSVKFDRFRKIRNRINYYGEDISVEEAKECIEEMTKLIQHLINKYIQEKL
jgi:hypothetical protein